MSRTAKIIAWLFAGAGALLAAGGGYWFSERDRGTPAEQVAVAPPPAAQDATDGQAVGTGQDAAAPQAASPVVETSPAPVEKPAGQQAAVEPAPAPATVPAIVPSFDVLRVERDGSAVVAGSAAPGSKVELLSQGQVVASADAGASGDFAIVLDTPLTPGSHTLSLRTTDASGAQTLSQETGIVDLPQEGGELIAMVTKPGEASRIMQSPAGQADAGGAAAPAAVDAGTLPQQEKPAEPGVEVASAPPAQGEPAAGEPAAGEPVAGAAEAPAAQSSEPAPAPAPAPEPATRPVMVQAVDVEKGRIFVAGSGEPGRVVNVYIGEELVGSATVNADGGFLLEAAGDLATGEHSIRVDMLAPGSAEVTNRASVELVHEEPQVEVAKAEPAQDAAQPAAQPADGPAATPQAEPAQEAQPAQGGAAQPADTGTQAASEVAAADPATVQQPQQIRTGASVIIRRGDNLWRISRRMLGRGIQYTVIYEANRDQIRNPSLIYPGQVFDVPGAIEGSGDTVSN